LAAVSEHNKSELPSDPGADAVLVQTAPPGRIVSVDVLRGLTILLMVFVNDLGHAAPAWMHHIEPSNADGMTLADFVFPCFLFIVGVSVPLAFEHARAAGTRTLALIGHILARSIGLLMMGVIVLNAEEDLSRVGPAWGPLAFVAILFAWCSIPRLAGLRRNILIGIKSVGILGLIGLLAWYRRKPHDTELLFYGKIENWPWLQSGWWGILGLIGWAYLTVALLTLILGRRREWLMGALAVLMSLHVVIQGRGVLSHLDTKMWLDAAKPMLDALRSGIDYVGQYVGLADATGSLAAITMAGCLLGSILTRGSDVTTHRARLSWACTFAIGLFIAGAITDSFEGINKNSATPTWCLWSAAIATCVWMLLYLVIDVARLQAWTIIVRPAGANPLIAYFLHPIIAESAGILGLGDTLMGYRDSASSSVAIAGSLGMALVVCLTTALLARVGLRVRL
jgi:heparan-alpha-glucosaminide N-acetyltransferase